MKVVLWMIGALFSFCFMAVGARELSDNIGVFQVLSIRSVIGIAVIAFIIVKSKKTSLFHTQRIKTQVGRNLVHFLGQVTWFVGIGLLPLAEVFAIEFTAPLWTLLIAAVFLKEKLTPRKCMAVFLGLVGVYIILQPDSNTFNSASIIVLVAAISFGFTFVATKSLSTSDEPLTILFYMCLLQLPMGLVLTGFNWVMPNAMQWGWIVIISLTALSAHFCINNALKLAEVGVVVTLDFLRLPLIALVGVMFYSEAFNMTLMIGALVMLVGNLLNAYQPKPVE